MKQRLEDTLLLLRENRKAQFVAICIMGAIAFLIVGGGSNPRRAQQPVSQQADLPIDTASGAKRAEQAYEDYTTSLRQTTKDIKIQNKQLQEELAEMRERREEDQRKVAEIMKVLIQRVEANEKSAAPRQGGDADPVIYADDDGIADPETEELTSFGDIDDNQVVPPPPPAPNLDAYISPADSVRVQLLAGVNAPTDGTPYPVIFKLLSDIRGPDGSALPLGEARLIAAAQGSLTDARALFRLTTLSMRFPDGSRRDVEVDGWIVGEDGIRGMEGQLIDPLGKALGAAFVTGTLSGLGQGIAGAQTTTTITNTGQPYSYVDGDTLSFALGRGLQGASSEWSEIIRERLQQLVPVVKVFSGREATAVFARPVRIDGLYEMLTVAETDIYGTLD